MSDWTLSDISEKLRDIDFAMLLTRTESGEIAGRPMSNNRDVEYDGDSFFFARDNPRGIEGLLTMRLRDTAGERFGPFTLHPVLVARIRLTRCTSTSENQREAEDLVEGLNHGPRFNAVAHNRNLGRDGGYVRSDDGV